jgi:hypothetical protein
MKPTGLALLITAGMIALPLSAWAADERKLSEEIILLGKLGRTQERGSLLNQLPPPSIQTVELGAVAADARLDDGKTADTMAYLTRIREISPGSREADRLEARTLLAMDRPADALSVIDRRLGMEPDPEIRNLRLQPLMQLERWNEAASEAERARTADDIYFFKDRRTALMEGRSSAGFFIKFLNGPQGLRERTAEETLQFWSSPELRWKVTGQESFFTRPSIGETVSERENVWAHEVLVEWVTANGLITEGGYRQSYTGARDYAEPFVGARVFGGGWDASLRYRMNRPITSPVEAIPAEAHENTLKANVRRQITDRLAAGYDLEARWERLNGAVNSVNGQTNLGEIYTHDLSAEFRVLNDPSVTLQYHYLKSEWEQAFDEAETVLGLLEHESRHSFGVYALFNLHRDLDVNFSFSQARDTKRDTWQLVFAGGLNWWITERMRLEAGLEYDYGDSGVAGGGNSVIATAGLVWGWG